MITAEDVVIPSTNGEPPVELAGRIYHPSLVSPTSRSLAVIAHPYGFLGGTQHDHVVVAIARRLARLGITALTYDSRGCGASQGRASWRGEPERRDYERMIEWLVERHGASATTIFTCGYSYGSIMSAGASHPPGLRRATLLISPPLSFIGAMTLFSTSPASLAQRRAGDQALMVACGGGDQFTAPLKCAKWAQNIGASVTLHADDSADHFWRDLEAKERLLGAIETWAQHAMQ